MHRLPLAVLLLLTACSAPTSRPAEYQQGAYRPPPRAPAFSPTQDAPHTVGQPGYVKPLTEYPRSPNKRYVPPEPDGAPGLWAGDGPRAGERGLPVPKLFNEPLPPVTSLEPEHQYGPATACVARWNRIMPGEPELREAVERLRGQQKRCAVMWMFNLCAVRFQAEEEAMGNKVPPAIHAVRRAGERVVQDECVKPNVFFTMEPLLLRLRDAMVTQAKPKH